MTQQPPPKRRNVVLVAGGRFHDIDFARLELLKLLAEDERNRVRVFEDYRDLDALRAAEVLVTYTCDVMPALHEQEALRAWLEAGGRWLALHGTNAILRILKDGVDSPRWAPHLMQTLGSQFVAHPPIQPYRVEVADPGHPLVEGVQPFDADDELYLSEYHGDLHVLLDTHWPGGEATGFFEKDWPQARHPVFYVKRHGAGAVLYLTLGHCRGHYDMGDFGMDYYPVVERGSWALPVYYELLRRGLRWTAERG